MATTTNYTSPLVHPYLPSFLLFANGNSNTAGENSSSFSLDLTEYPKMNDIPVDRKALQTVFSYSVANPISCMEWNPNPLPFYYSIGKGGYSHDEWNEFSPGLLAIGTQTGSVSLINWKNIASKSNIVVEERELCTNTNNNKEKDRERGPGPCSAVSWNKLKCTQLAAGFENSKSDNCVLVWDIEHSPQSQMYGSVADVSLRLCSGESASSVSWLADNPFLLAVGTSMGLVRIFDVRSRTAAVKISPPSPPVAPHQKVTSTDEPHILHSLVRNPSLPPLQPVLSLMTHTGQRPRKVRRIVPDPNRPAVFATFSDVAGDAVKIWDLVSLTGPAYNSTIAAVSAGLGTSPSFTIQPKPVNSSVPASVLDAAWICSRNGLLALALNGQKGIFLYSAPINSSGTTLTASSSSSVASSQVPLLVLPTTSIVRSVSSLGNDLRTYLNCKSSVGGPTVEAPWLLDSLFVTTMSSPSGVTGSSRLSVTSRPTVQSSSLWQLQCIRVRERIPLAFSSNMSGFLAVALTGRRGVGYEERVAFRTSYSQESESTQCIQRRAQLGYSLDASENLEILADELNQIFAIARQQLQGGVECPADFLRESERLISAHRVWVWVNRVESDSEHNISFRKCGALDILRQVESSNRTSVLGKQMYLSKDRSQCRVFCGWLPEPTTSSEEEESLLSIVEDHEEQNCFERAAAIAIWHGNLPLAVRMLQAAVDKHQNMESNGNAKCRDDGIEYGDHDSGNEPEPEKDLAEPVEWDAIVTDAYMQVVNLVVVCLAGYSFTTASSSSTQTSPSSVSSSWIAMNRLLVTKVQLFVRSRRSAAYLAASLLFLSSGDEQSPPTTTSPQLSAAYKEVLDSEGILLEDRIAFAVSYLPTPLCFRWLEECKNACIFSAQLDGLFLTGFGKDGMELLQQHLDIHGDIQVVSLLASRLIDAASCEPNANLPSMSSTSLVALPSKPAKEWIWLHEYRQLLNRAELFVERATLDVTLNKRCQLKKSFSSALPLGSAASTGGRVRFATAGAGSASRSNAGGSHKRSAYTLPPQANVAHIFLRCHYCGATLPVDGLFNRLDNNRLNQLMVQKSNINSCGFCTKQLPKCYVCQLNLGMVNPYLERLAIHNRSTTNSKSASTTMESDGYAGLSRDKAPGRDFTPKKLGWDREPAATPSASSHHHNTIGMNRWLFFCQSCKHGGHMDCIEDWFAERTLTLPSGETQVLSRRRCGVNGCTCVCKAR